MRTDAIVSLTDAREPPPTDFREVCGVCRVLPQKMFFYEASEHDGGDESQGDGQVKRRKGAQNEGE